MNFELGYYRTRNGSIIKLTEITPTHLEGYKIIDSPKYLTKIMYWDLDGNIIYYSTGFDLMEYLKVKENNKHDGVSLKSYIEENLGTSSNEGKS